MSDDDTYSTDDTDRQANSSLFDVVVFVEAFLHSEIGSTTITNDKIDVKIRTSFPGISDALIQRVFSAVMARARAFETFLELADTTDAPRVISAPTPDGAWIVRVAAGTRCACGAHDVRPTDFKISNGHATAICPRRHFDVFIIEPNT